MSPKVAIIAALEREVKPIIVRWRSEERDYAGRRFRFFMNDRAVLVCGGIGPVAARRATEAVISLYTPHEIVSVGFAGALDPSLNAGAAFVPQRVVDAGDSSVSILGTGSGTLVSFGFIAGKQQKESLAKAYGAQAVDMEAAAVARAAQAHGLPFGAMKAVSDEHDFEMPEMERFIRDGHFCATSFVAWTAAQPWLWPVAIRLARNSARASRTLCDWLQQYNHPPEKVDDSRAGLHLISR
jgi:adenosylhomocysteine nucleosidase